jgi:hypothetical protein
VPYYSAKMTLSIIQPEVDMLSVLYAECQVFIVMPSVVELSIMLFIVVLNVVRLSVLTPHRCSIGCAV